MPEAFRVCKICGNEYLYCKTRTKNRFRYQDVACCAEHAVEYFRKVEAARANTSENKVTVSEVKSESSVTNAIFNSCVEDLFEYDFDDDFDEDNEGYSDAEDFEE